MRFAVAVEGTAAAARTVAGPGQQAQHPQEAYEAIRDHWMALNRGMFAHGGLRGSWAPDRTATTRRKAARGQDPRVMRATGALEASLTRPGGPGSVFRPLHDGLELGTNLDQARYSQSGQGRERRRTVVVAQHQRREWADIFREHLLQGGQ